MVLPRKPDNVDITRLNSLRQYHKYHGIVFFTKNFTAHRSRDVVLLVKTSETYLIERLDSPVIADIPLVITYEEADVPTVHRHKWTKQTISWEYVKSVSPRCYSEVVDAYVKSKECFNQTNRTDRMVYMDHFAYLMSSENHRAFNFLSEIFHKQVDWVQWEEQFNISDFPYLWQMNHMRMFIRQIRDFPDVGEPESEPDAEEEPPQRRNHGELRAEEILVNRVVAEVRAEFARRENNNANDDDDIQIIDQAESDDSNRTVENVRRRRRHRRHRHRNSRSRSRSH